MNLVDAVRRVLWLAPVLMLGAGALFAAFSHTIAPAPAGSALFFEPAPRHAEAEAERALARLWRGDPEAPRRLVHLGGAALPYLLERLDTLSVDEQRRLADALWPLTRRIGLGERDALALEERASESDRRVSFWREFHEEHASDFRPLFVQRLVRRLSARDLSLRRADLLIVDTYALPALVEQLGRVQTPADVERVRRVAELISHATERDFRVKGDDVAEARRLAGEIRAYWDRRGPDFTSLGRVELLAASLSQTEFSIWLRRSLRQLSKLDENALGARLARGASVSAPAFTLALLGALVLGPALAALVQVLETTRRVPWAGRLSVRGGLALALCSLIPGALFAPLLAPWLRNLLALGAGALPSTFLLSHELARRLDWRTHQLLRRRGPLARVRAIWRWLGPSLPTLSPLVAAEAALCVTCLEVGSGMPGLGWETWRAVQEGDLPWLMLSSLSLGLFTGSTQLICDAVLGTRRLSWRGGE